MASEISSDRVPRDDLKFHHEPTLVLEAQGNQYRSRGEFDQAASVYLASLVGHPNPELARRSLVSLLIESGRISEALDCVGQEPQETGGGAWLRSAMWKAMEAGHLRIAARYAEALSVMTLAADEFVSKRYGCRSRSTSSPRRFLTLAQLEHDIQQIDYLMSKGILGLDWVERRANYVHAGEKMHSLGPGTRIDLDEDEELRSMIGDTYGKIFHLRDAPRLKRALSHSWDPHDVDEVYIANRPGIVVVDDFLEGDTLNEILQFCLESTVWLTNRYEHGRLGAFFSDGFNCALLVQLAEEISAALPRTIGDRYRLNQLWAFKSGEQSVNASNLHADFAAVNVNIWITPDNANSDPAGSGLIVYDLDAPLRWGCNIYNDCVNTIQPFLDRNGARSILIPYRQNRAIIFNSDLFHGTAPFRFLPGYGAGMKQQIHRN